MHYGTITGGCLRGISALLAVASCALLSPVAGLATEPQPTLESLQRQLGQRDALIQELMRRLVPIQHLKRSFALFAVDGLPKTRYRAAPKAKSSLYGWSRYLEWNKLSKTETLLVRVSALSPELLSSQGLGRTDSLKGGLPSPVSPFRRNIPPSLPPSISNLGKTVVYGATWGVAIDRLIFHELRSNVSVRSAPLPRWPDDCWVRRPLLGWRDRSNARAGVRRGG